MRSRSDFEFLESHFRVPSFAMTENPEPEPSPASREPFPRWFSLRPQRRWHGSPKERYEQWRIDRLAAWLGLAAVLLVAMGFSIRPVTRLVRGYHARSLVAEGLQLIQARDWNAAGERIREASMLAPADPQVRVARARLFSRAPAEVEVKAWEEVLEHVPNANEYAAWHALALTRAGRAREAEAALARLPEALRGTGRARAAQGAISTALNRREEAVSALRDAVRLLPKEPELALALGQILLSGSPGRMREGVDLLESLNPDPETRRMADAILVQHFLATGAPERARPPAERLVASKEAEFSDSLLLAAVLLRLRDEVALATLLASLDPETRRSPRNFASLLLWLLGAGRLDEALATVDRSSREMRAPAPLTPLLAELWDRGKRQRELQALLREGDWSTAPIARIAYQARAASLEGSNSPQRPALWAKARQLAKDDTDAQESLLVLARRWQWGPEQLELHRTLAADPSTARLAQLRAWHEASTQQRSTLDTFLATQALLARGEKSLVVANDFAATAFLLGRELPKAHAIALEFAQQRRSAPEMTATVVTSLRLQGRLDEAWKYLQYIPQAALKIPSIALEHALLQRARGQLEAARSLAASIRAEELCAEEQALLAGVR